MLKQARCGPLRAEDEKAADATVFLLNTFCDEQRPIRAAAVTMISERSVRWISDAILSGKHVCFLYILEAGLRPICRASAKTKVPDKC
jgi:hypothetical protein